jgi:hypothetical protein
MSNVLPLSGEKAAIRYFHGGNRGLRVGDYLLPPKAEPKAGFADHPLHQEDCVYVSIAPAHAYFFGSARPDPIVYEVAPEGAVALDPDCNTGVSFTCPKAKIVAIHEIPRTEIAKYRAMMAANELK